MLNYGCEGLRAVISGGTSGIGLATAAKLLADGAEVYILGRSSQRGRDAAAKLLKMTGRTATYIQCDVRSSASCRAAMEQVGGKLNILINSAGVYMEQRLENMDDAAYSDVMDTNVKGTMLLTQAALPYMYGAQHASIVNVASDAGVRGNYGCPVYCASKGAIVALSRALALDLAPGIRVNCVCPADVDTPLLAKQLRDADGGYSLSDMAAAYPLQRIGAADEVAHVICMAASPANGFMTGSVISIDGGVTA